MANGGRSYRGLLSDSTLAVASVTGMLYLIGYLYYAAFFKRLSIPYGSIDLSISQCITAALLPIGSLIVGGMVLFILDSPKFKNKFEGKWVRMVSLLILIFIVSIIFVNWQMWMSSYIMVIITFILISFLLIISFLPKLLPYTIACMIIIFFQIPNDSFTYASLSLCVVVLKLVISFLIVFETFKYIKSTRSEILSNINKISDTIFLPMSLILILLVFCCFSIVMGIYNADCMTDGDSADALKINISLKDENNTMFENKTLILIMMHDGTYYIIEKDESHSKKPRVYIIPSDQIKMVTVYEKGKGPIIDLIIN